MKYEGAGLKEEPPQPSGGSDRIRGKPSHGRRSGSSWFRTWSRFVLAATASAFITLFAIDLLPDLLPASTDIVGYPIWAPFDTRRYSAIYVLWMVLFPLLTAIGYVLLGGSGRTTDQPRFEWPRFSRAAPAHGDQRRPGRVGVASALVLVVLPVALAFGVAADADGGSFAIALLVMSTVAVLVLALLAVVAGRHGALALDDAVWALVALMAPASVLWLSVLSSRSGVRVKATGTFHGLHWFPFWLGIPAALLAVGVVAWLLRHRSRDQWMTIARWSLICITVPVLLWELMGALSPALGSIDAFHEGEGLVGARLLLDGQVPWRDFLFTHGLLDDTLVSLPGLALIEDSRWGANSGELIWVAPAYWIFWFGFMAYLLRRNTWLLVLWSAVTVLGSSLLTAPWVSPIFFVFSQAYTRMLLYPLILMAVAWVVRNPISRRIALLSGLLVLQVVLTPETAYLVPGVFIALILYDLTRSAGVPTLRRFTTSGLTVLWCLAFSVVLAGVLVMTGSLGAFVDYFEVFAFGHELTGGLPYAWGGSVFGLAAVGVPLLLLGCSWYGLARLVNRRPLETDDFVIVPAFVFGALYHTKFLTRPDAQHAIQSMIVMLPVLWYVIARLLDVVDGVWQRRASSGSSTRGVSVALVTIALVLMVPALVDTTDDLPARYRPTVASEPLDERLGYTAQAINNLFAVPVDRFIRTADDVGQVVDALAPETRHVFDFTNSPVMFGFALRYGHATRYYHVSMAIPLKAQRDLISDLEESDPAVVVGYGDAMGLPNWDQIPNMVRHYEVNRYLQTHYRPVVAVDGLLFLLRDDLSFEPDSIRELDLNGVAVFGNLDDVPTPCDWRAAPERFEPQPAPKAPTTGALPLVDVDGTLEITGWVADMANGEPVPQVVALAADGTVLAAAAPTDIRQDAGAAAGSSGASGFSLEVPVGSSEPVVVAAKLADGTLLDLVNGSISIAAPEVSLADREASAFDGSTGEVEEATFVPISPGTRAYRTVMPGSPRDWNWLTIEGDPGLPAGSYTVGLPAGEGDIRLLLTHGPQATTNLMVGACNQWYDYQSQVRVISTPEGTPAPRIELVG